MADEISHGDIYRALGILEGKLDSMSQSLNQKHTDLTSALTRIGDLERTVAKGIGIALACSIIIPLLVSAIAPRIQIGHEPATHHDSQTP